MVLDLPWYAEGTTHSIPLDIYRCAGGKERTDDLVRPKAGVPTTAALLSRCALFVGNDSAMMHLAAATGIRTVGLFGPTRDDLYGPWGPQGLVVRTPESVSALLARLRHAKEARCLMEGLSAAAVGDAITARWPDLRGAALPKHGAKITEQVASGVA